MAFEWNDRLSTTIDWQDDQHKELLSVVNNLYVELKRGTDEKAIGEILDFLTHYVIDHFSIEEKFMDKYNYPEVGDHKKEHQLFLTDFTKFQERFLKEGASLSLILLIQYRVTDWLMEHIAKSDKALGAFMQENLTAAEKKVDTLGSVKAK